ncbi:GTP 3',8-cyclase MoaA [Pedobacter sp. SYSU D00535]|uniref:GTP 3',8-cyclase MoaA n=1 Tax=Pedobacter sp. SYSU D00535 TaxID=2810308 RepID=UPI001A97B59F|nr:GTP 3',8-cyclase MoaA [Pedobacter sp. SYSU D00535]
MRELRDEFGRRFKTLRVSLINTCNLGCVYCTCGTEDLKENHILRQELGLTPEELSSVIKQLHQMLDLETVRFTGGEPLLYKNLAKIIRQVRELGIQDLKLTTNGLLLEQQAAELKEAGLRSVNVSLDAIDEDIFYKVSRRSGIDRILNGIEAAIGVGIEVKINSVIMKGLNESQLLPLLDFAFQRNIKIRFLEIMAMGHLHGQADQYFFSQEEMLERIGTQYSFSRLLRKHASTANYWQTTEGQIFGVVANESEPFCGDCNRLRLDSLGNIYGCLSSNHPISVRSILSEDQLAEKLQQALKQKQSLKFTGSSLSMLTIGG